jgi:hypothetical protein
MSEWVPEACTLPSVEQPLRVAEFDELFGRAVRGVRRVEPGRIRLELEPTSEVAARAADLVVRETGCCSFFTFALIATGGELHLEVSVPETQVAVLDALAARADAGAGVA